LAGVSRYHPDPMAALWRVLATLLASLAVRLCVYVLDQGPMPGQPKKRKFSCSCSCYRLKPNRVSVWSWVTHGNAYEWRGAWFDCHYFGVHRNFRRFICLVVSMDAQTGRWFIAMFIGIAFFIIGMALHYVP